MMHVHEKVKEIRRKNTRVCLEVYLYISKALTMHALNYNINTDVDIYILSVPLNFTQL